MINILSYVGLNLQAEVCLWSLLGILRTIFDATLFRVNSNLKQVWQMELPEELSFYVQRILRTMISGVMLVQCFTVYVYLASYIVLLYPEERPALVLPWLLLAAIRSLLCELVSLALGLAACVLMGPARPPCFRFLLKKFATITPAVYMWKLVYWYYHTLKVAATCTAITMVLPTRAKYANDLGLELAVRRRLTKSLLGEDELRKIMANLHDDKSEIVKKKSSFRINAKETWTSNNRNKVSSDLHVFQAFSVKSPTATLDSSSNEDWYGVEVVTPRDTDRVLVQFVTMLLKIRIYLGKGFNNESMQQLQISDNSGSRISKSDKVNNNSSLHPVESPPAVGSCKTNIASYARAYPQIFMKHSSENKLPTDNMKVLLDNNYNKDLNRSAVRLKSDSFNKIERQRERDIYKSDNSSLEGNSNYTENIRNRESQIPITNSGTNNQYYDESTSVDGDPNSQISNDIVAKLIKSKESSIINVIVRSPSSITNSKEELRRESSENILQKDKYKNVNN